MWLGWRIALGVVLTAGTFLLFRYVGEFSSKQSWALTIACVIFDAAYRRLYRTLEATHYAEHGFRPFYVCVLPNWPKLLLDYKLIRDIEEWHRLRAKNTLPGGFFFTVLKPGLSFGFEGPNLIYWNDRKVFVTKVDFSERIEGIKFEDEISTRIGLELPPAIYCRHGELGIAVRHRWWEQICAKHKELANVKVDTDFLTGTTEVPVATLPVEQFETYHSRDWERDWKHQKKQLKKLNEKRDKLLAANGWKRKSPDYDDETEELEHEYFTIEHRAI